MTQRSMLLCTVGTSLFQPNLEGLRTALREKRVADNLRELAEAYNARDWDRVAEQLGRLPSHERLCGAEINSIACLLNQDMPRDCGLFFFHSQTEEGRAIAAILQRYYQSGAHAPVEAMEIPDLQDSNPKLFRTRGLRNLARAICRVVRERSAGACAINATGGYKAQIAIAVLLGQALGIPVYYKHERFSEIIPFPPMPVSLDFEVWMRASDMLYLLAKNDLVPAADWEAQWDERYETLVERETIDGQSYLVLSPTGQIFHEAFRERFRSIRDRILPPPVPVTQKRAPRLETGAGWPGNHPEVEHFLQRITDEVPQVVHCGTYYFNPELPERMRFSPSRDGIIGIWSNGQCCVKFRLETSAQTEGQRAAVVAALNDWLDNQGQ